MNVVLACVVQFKQDFRAKRMMIARHQSFNVVLTMAHLYEPPDKKPPPWRHSPAKALLKEGMLSGRYPETMAIQLIYADKPEFRQYPYDNFKTNCGNLREALNHEIDRAIKDDTNYSKDKPLYSNGPDAGAGGYIPPLPGQEMKWAGSDAEKKLKEDVDNKLHETMKPSDLRSTRPEYMEWPLAVFRDHITQEVRSRFTQAYWLHRSKQAKTEPWPEIDSL